MALSDIRENRKVADQLSGLLKSGRTVHAFLLVGQKASADALADEFAKAILCPEKKGDSCGACVSCRKFDHGDHEDLIVIQKPDNRQSIVVSQIEELQAELMLRPFGNMRAVIIRDAQLMSVPVQNKLLKTLEEPPEGTVLVLTADNREQLLPTVLSRCSCYNLSEGKNKADVMTEDLAEAFASLLLRPSPFYRKKELLAPILESKDESRTAAMEFLLALENELEKRLLAGEDVQTVARAISLTEEAMRDLRQSYNTGYVLKRLSLGI